MTHRLAELDPHWILDASRRRVGVRFACPHCGELPGAVEICVLFSNPVGGGDPAPRGCRLPGDNEGQRWDRDGEILELLTLRPSVDCSQCGHWHGVLAGGITS